VETDNAAALAAPRIVDFAAPIKERGAPTTQSGRRNIHRRFQRDGQA
jgi:hypothetical protein